MFEDFAPKLADLLTGYCVPVHEGDLAVINASVLAEPLIEALGAAIMRRGGHVYYEVHLRNTGEQFYKIATDAQLNYVNPIHMAVYDKADIFYAIRAPSNPKTLSRIDPNRLKINQQAGKPLQDRFQEREAAGELRWNITAWPTYALAQEAEMGFLDYQEFVYKAAGLDQPDPVAYWETFRDRQLKLSDWLKDKKHCEVRGPGIEMSFDFEGRTWVSCHGERNFPDGEIFTSPIENTVEGHVEFNYPSLYGGREINGVKLTFKEGVVVEASAAKGEDYLLSQLETDEGARRLGEFAIGTNMGIQDFTREILFDEKIGGTIHMALGLGLVNAGGVNKSVVHWDMVHGMRDGGEVYIDGDLFYKSGEFTI